MTCPHRFSDGAYVLGALSPSERVEFERHLTDCPPCAEAVRQLAPLPGLLGRVDPAGILGDPTPSRLPELLAAVTASRRRARFRRRVFTAAAAAVVAVAVVVTVWAGLGGLQGGSGESPFAAPAERIELSPADPWAPVTAEVAVTGTQVGAVVWMSCWYEDGGGGTPYPLRLMVVAADGSVEQVASWLVGPGDHVELTGTVRFDPSELVRIEVQDLAGRTLLAHDF